MAASWLALVGTLVVYHSLEAAATKIHEQRRFFILFHLPDQLFCRGKTDFITNFFHQLHGDGLTIKIAIKAEQMASNRMSSVSKVGLLPTLSMALYHAPLALTRPA